MAALRPAANLLRVAQSARGQQHALLTALQPISSTRGFHASAASQIVDEDALPRGEDDGGDGGEDGGRGKRDVWERLGRPFLDPRAPRRQEAIRNDPKNKDWGVMIDILEHAAYCDGQREEDPDGFFFDMTTPEYDSDCDGDPFANGYLTEDEYEWPEEYKPEPPVPGRVMDQIYFLRTAHKYPISRLCTKYGLSSERVSAILSLKASEPDMIATGRYLTAADTLLQEIYRGSAGSKEARGDNWKPEFDLGVNFNIMQDDQMPDDAYPIKRTGGTLLRQGHPLPRVEPPAGERGDRKHKSKFVFRDVSSTRRRNKMRYSATEALLVSDYDGAIRPASNLEALYRSWETRYWTLDASKGRSGFPFRDEDAHKPANFHITP